MIEVICVITFVIIVCFTHLYFDYSRFAYQKSIEDRKAAALKYRQERIAAGLPVPPDPPAPVGGTPINW